MLIKCPECNNEISDKSEICIHCGYPIKNEMEQEANNICVIDGVPRDLTEQLENISNPNYKPLYKFGHEYGMSLADAVVLSDMLEVNKVIPKEYNSSDREKYRKQLNEIEQKKQNKPKCPTCGSVNVKPITATERAVSVVGLGLMSKKINKTYKCLNCKCTW